jgi:hypothetical protein
VVDVDKDSIARLQEALAGSQQQVARLQQQLEDIRSEVEAECEARMSGTFHFHMKFPCLKSFTIDLHM